MADLPLGNEVNLNGTTAVTLLAAPATSKQRSVPANGVSFYNADTVSHDFTLQKNKNSTIYVLWKKTVAAGITELVPKKVVLDATDESLEVKMEAAHTTTAPTADVAALETS